MSPTPSPPSMMCGARSRHPASMYLRYVSGASVMCESALMTGNGHALIGPVSLRSMVDVMTSPSGGGGRAGAAHEAARQGAGVLAVGVGLLAGDERVQVAVG